MGAKSPYLSAPFAGLLALCASCVVLLLAPCAQAATCPNEAVRAEQGSAALALPDCRAYELVSPGSTPSQDIFSKQVFGGGRAAFDGDALSYFSRYPARGSDTSSETWLSRRTVDGWSVEGLVPQMTPSPTTNGECQPGVAFSEQLDTYLLSAGGEIYSAQSPPSLIGECEAPQEEIVPGEPHGYSNLYLHREGSPYLLANPVPPEKTPANATYQAGSSDLSRIVFSEGAQLTPEAPFGVNLFEWADGIIRLIGVLPNGEPVPAKLGAATENWGGGGGALKGLAPVSHAVSDDGERVFFEAGGSLYVRQNAGQAPAADANCVTTSEPDLACTLQLDFSFGPGAHGGGVFQFASSDGERAFFTSDHKLTLSSKAEPGRPDLYEYRVDSHELMDLTVSSSGTASVRGISGGSDDGSHLYFVARGILTGSEQNDQGEVAQSGQPNLYLAREGSLTYVATLSPWEEKPVPGGKDRSSWWEPNAGNLSTAWSPSGRYLLFSSYKPLTGFDNTPAAPGLCVFRSGPPCQELFLYDAETEALNCVSCSPDDERPVAHTELVERQEFKRFGPGPRYAPRVVLDSGQVFFETENALSPTDVNGFQDVYEYRAGSLNPISSGKAEGGSGFVDASADGSDIFFTTSQSLVRADGDGGRPSIYDARINGGFAEPPLPLEPCTSDEACRSIGRIPSPPLATPLTATFVGEGNVRPRRCKPGKVRREGRCLKKGKRHRKHQSGQHQSGGKN
ncbi:MAG TPA: hypothetical protein VFS54_01030 [Solirubrobacterales bacterium]|nr:hypothetical protein [Solirubrobacterales bacterium]